MHRECYEVEPEPWQRLMKPLGWRPRCLSMIVHSVAERPICLMTRPTQSPVSSRLGILAHLLPTTLIVWLRYIQAWEDGRYNCLALYRKLPDAYHMSPLSRGSDSSTLVRPDVQRHLGFGTVLLETWIPHARNIPLDGFLGKLEGKGGNENGEDDL